MLRNPRGRYRWLGRRAAIVAAFSLASMIGVFFAREHARGEYQKIAEQAALAGVKSLQESSGQSETQRRSAAIAASRVVAQITHSDHVRVRISVDPIRVLVELWDTPAWLQPVSGGFSVVGKAGYAPATTHQTAIGGEQQASLAISASR